MSMSLFGAPKLSRNALRPRRDQRWIQAVNAVMTRFQASFPEIKYDIAWEVDLLNGSAWRERAQRHVRLYGGILRHKLIGLEACALLFAHETGHHNGGAPRDIDYEWMTCECQADYWAARHGVRIAMGDAEWRPIVERGAEQILSFEESMIEAGLEWATGDTSDLDCLDHVSPHLRYKTFLSGLANVS
jgi:hypothetical protein